MRGSTLSGPEPPRWSGRWVLYALGTAAIAWGLYGIHRDAVFTAPANWLAFFVGSALVHDALLAPVVALVAVVLVRRVPPPYRSLVQGGLFVTAAVTLVALPFVAGFGRRADNPSVLPLPYGRNLLVVLGLVWLGVAALALLRWRLAGADRTHPPPVPPPAS